MTEREDFVMLLSAALGGVLANGSSFSAKANLVQVAVQHAEDAMAEVNARYKPETAKMAAIPRRSARFAQHVEMEPPEESNGNGHS